MSGQTTRPYKLKSSFIEASAGTGKTYTIMEIVGDLIQEHKIPLTNILILTYTEKAAGELKERLRKKLLQSDLTKEARELDQVTISTIHGFCNMILQEYPVETESPSNWILTEAKERLKAAMYRLQHEEWKNYVNPNELESLLSESDFLENRDRILSAGAKLLSGKKYPYNNDSTPFSPENFLQKTALIAKKMVEEEFKDGEWMSYDQMILKTRDSLKNPFLKKALQNRYQIGILDEFQDTDAVQYEIFSRLFLDPSPQDSQRALYLIGDPKQSIYGFRGADIGTYLRAKKELKTIQAEEIPLDVNYRSVPELIQGYNEIFGGKTGDPSFFPIIEKGFESQPILYSNVKHPEKDDKVRLSPRHNKGPIQIVRFQGRETWKNDEARIAWGQFISEEILKLVSSENSFSYETYDERSKTFQEKRINFKEIAILVKSKAEGKLVEQALKLRAIPCSFYKQEGIYQSPESIQIRNILECLLDPNKPSSYRKLLLGDLFQVHPNHLPYFDEHSIDSYEKSILDRWKVLAMERKFAELFRSIEEDSRIFLTEEKTDIAWERKRTNYRQIFRKLLQFQIANQAGLEEVLEELKQLQSEKRNEEELPLFEKETEKDAVQILTLHASKGLEWSVVFLFNLSGNFTPEVYDYPFVDSENDRTWKLSLWDNEEEGKISKEEYSNQNLNENKRLLYVGITRPKVRLYLPFFTPLNNWKTRDSAYFKILYPRLQAILENEPDQRFFQSLSWTPRSPDSMDQNILTETLSPEVIFTPLVLQESYSPKTVWIHSYSSLKSKANVALDEQPLSVLEGKSLFKSDEIEDSPLETEDTLPSSAATGSFLHLLLEELDFSLFETETSKEPLKNDRVVSRMDFHLDYFQLSKTKQKDTELEKELYKRRACEILWNSLNAKITSCNRTSFRLLDIPNEKRISEMDFHLDLDPQRSGPGNYLKGSIDLVFEFENRFYLADYKSNLLDDYSLSSLKRSIESPESRYDLQRDIYAMILFEYLKSLFGEKEAFQKLGGVFYFYLRGMKPEEEKGIYSDFDWSLKRLNEIKDNVFLLTNQNWEDFL
ncbi:UvrD-helicase domain-containing protein [Leptospira sp. 201903071]|uniref:UvrD-helicase domain-containing protein n=1 Tax=Leptospira ainazelensis TaxID=2810034 RepID=UPI00196310F1|nr:UvrD-helicase domain-containing protein [Leptospira ainazelensis]MBM9499193.1 UvrD-helicase domain-containing protein [Leptospira ainazelensis]